MSNTPVLLDALAKKILSHFLANGNFVKTSNRTYEDEVVSKNGLDRGQTVRIRKPNNFLSISDNLDVTSAIKDVTERSIDLAVDKSETVPFQFSASEWTGDFSQMFDERVAMPTAATLAAKVESRLAAAMVLGGHYTSGTAGSAPQGSVAINNVRAKMNSYGIPEVPLRYGNMDEIAYSEMLSNGNFNNLFMPSKNKGIIEQYRAGNVAGFDILHNIVTPKHTTGVGDAGETPASGFVSLGTVKTAVSTGTAVICESVANNSTVKAGDKLRISGTGVRGLNTKNPTLEPFPYFECVVTADATSAAGTEITLAISPSVISSSTSPYQNVSVEIPVGATVALVTSATVANTAGTYASSFFYHNDALLFAAPAFRIFDSSKQSVAIDPTTGISIMITKELDGLTLAGTYRADIQFGYKVNPEYFVTMVS